jgi:hypothetical protein
LQARLLEESQVKSWLQLVIITSPQGWRFGAWKSSEFGLFLFCIGRVAGSQDFPFPQGGARVRGYHFYISRESIETGCPVLGF